MGGTPVTPAPAGPQIEDSSAPNQIPSVPPQGVMTPAGAAYQAPPGLWHRVLTGALEGLAGSAGQKHFGGGVAAGAAGAINTEMAKEKQAANIRFQDAENAYRAAALQRQDEQLALQGKEYQDAHAKTVAELRQLNMEYGIPVDDLTNNGAAVVNHLETATANAGATGQQGATVAPGTQVTADSIHQPNYGAANIDRLYELYAAKAKAMQMPTVTRAQFGAAGTKGRAQMVGRVDNMLMGLDPNTEQFMDPKKVETAIPFYQKAIADYSKQKDADPKILGIMQGTLDKLQLAQKNTPASAAKPVAGTLNGKPIFARDAGPGKGWVDVLTGEPLPGFVPPQNYAQVASNVANLRNETQTKEVLRPDGVHLMAFNPQTKNYDRDMGLAGTGAQGNRGAAASSSVRMGEDLIADIQANKDRLGGLSAWVQKYGLNTPVADPKLAKIQAELSSFAALQPVQHGFRSTSALDTFEKIIGGIQKNPEATIASIRGLVKTSGAINPTIPPEKKGKPAPAPGGDFFSKFGGQARQ